MKKEKIEKSEKKNTKKLPRQSSKVIECLLVASRNHKQH